MFSKWVSWGATSELGSHRHVLRHFHTTAAKMGIASQWLPDSPESNDRLEPGTVVFGFDISSQHLGVARPGVKYVIHNFDANHPVVRTADPQDLLRLQVYTNDAFGEKWAPFRFFHRESGILFQPWGTDLLPEEFCEPVFNATAQTVAFVGAVWSDVGSGVELGNEQTIIDLRAVLGERNIRLVHHTNVSDDENIRLVRESRIAPAFAGGWQVEHNYLPCRVFKNVSYGTVGVTNVPQLALRIHCPLGSIGQQLDWALTLKRPQYLELARAQQLFVADYTYRKSLEAINRAFEERE